MINKYILGLVTYGLQTGLIMKEDITYITNSLLDLFQIEEYDSKDEDNTQLSLDEILDGLLDYAYNKGLIKENSIVYRDLFDTKIMGILVPRPSSIIETFQSLYKDNPKMATEFYYKLSQDTNYIRRNRIKKDMKWVTSTEYGDMDITINLSKPEKDPKAIAAAKLMKASGYPKCLLCKENVGYAGRVNHPARQNHRIIPIQINNNDWGFQYSPYVYYNEHCIVFNLEHTPMKIEKATFRKLFDFVQLFPHYFVGSNADLPIVGGSILTHDHFQGGNYQFAMAKATIEKSYTITGYEDVMVGIVKWPMSVIRIKSKDTNRLVELGDYILKTWRNYSDSEANIYAYTDKNENLLDEESLKNTNISETMSLEPHNTITPIARCVDGYYELDLVLRNNITTNEHPFGVFHPHQELHHIKKENIGLIEVMGLAVLPARLKDEMELLKEYILAGNDISSNETIEKHAEWVSKFSKKYNNINSNNIDEIIQDEIGLVFAKVLEHAGVYKRDEKGKQAFSRFIDSLNK